MSYRHTLKRFVVDVEPNEDKDTFFYRLYKISKEESNRIGKEYCVSTDIHTSYIFDKNINNLGNSLNQNILSAVVEINEIPTNIQFEFGQLLVYHDAIKQTYDGNIVDIEYNDAENYIYEQIINLKSILTHVERLRNEDDNQI